PTVLFLTDGQYDLHPLFSPLLNQDQKFELLPEPKDQSRTLIQNVEAGKLRFVEAGDKAKIFDTRDYNLHQFELAPNYAEEIPERITKGLGSLMAHHFVLSESSADVCLLWAPIFLGEIQNSQLNEVRHLLTNHQKCDSWEMTAPFTHCSDANDLVPQFISVLSNWFQLQRTSIPQDAKQVLIPPDTKAFALTLQTRGKCNQVQLVQGQKKISLSGSGSTWAGVGSGGGMWQLELEGEVEGGMLHTRPRYEWTLLLPGSLHSATNGATLPLAVALYSLEQKAIVDASLVYHNLPKSLPVSVTMNDGSQEYLMDEVLALDPRGSRYSRDLILPSGFLGAVHCKANLTEMQKTAIPTKHEYLERMIECEPGLSIRITTEDGRDVALRSEVPGSAEKMRRLWSKVSGSTR
ncbi:MAG: hypothetical protein KDC10_12655, partial [Calditrichaeota bacterium]|nr:hypothetical protein [Calditrichota bacterium]